MTNDKLIVVHFDEVALKGGRRRYFVRKLIQNIGRCSPILADVPVRSLYDRILVGPLSDEQGAVAQEALSVMPGVAWFSEVTRHPARVEALSAIAEEFAELSRRVGFAHQSQKRRRAKVGTAHSIECACSFAVRTRRAKKDFPLVSVEINRELGRMIQDRTGWSVDLEHPDVTVYVDVTSQGMLTYAHKQRGPGGLPVGSTGKLVGLLSGGIDSPVAAYKMMCRGCRIVFVHFHNYGPQSASVRHKLIRLVEQLSRFQAASRLYLVPFADVQSELIAVVPPRMRMVAYRRAMLRLATPILRAEHAGGFVVGDSLGQVASQTLENLQATYPATDYPVLAPLIGESKRAIMEEAKRIGTYETSILPYDDCCQLLLAKSPQTRCTERQMSAFEETLNLDRHLEDVVQTAEVFDSSSW